MPVLEMTDDNFQSILDEHDTVIIDFWAQWCAPCRTFKPIFEEASERHPDVAFAICDIDGQPELAAALRVRSVPTVAVFREKVLLFSQPGLLPAEAIDDVLRQTAELDMDEVHREAQPAGAAAGSEA